MFQAEIGFIVDALAAEVGQAPFRKQLFLISGAQGLIGRYLVETLRRIRNTLGTPDLRVVAMDIVPSTEPDGDGIQYIQADVRNPGSNITALPYTHVVHLSGLASPVIYKREPLLTIEVAVDGSKQMLEIAKKHGAKYMFSSTSEVYQTPPPHMIPTPETYVGAIPTLSDRSCYDVSKALGETLAYVYYTKYGVQTTVVRFFNAFGVGMPERDQRILPRIASAIKGGKPLTVYGNKGDLPTRTYCPVANSVFGMILAMIKGSGACGMYNIGAPSPEITVPELCTLVGRAIGKNVPYDIVAPPAVYQTEPKRRCPDIRKAQNDLGYRIIVPLEDGLLSYMSWALKSYSGEV